MNRSHRSETEEVTRVNNVTIPSEYRRHWEEQREVIRRRLEEFRRVPRQEYHFELLYCLLTPQSRAKHAEEVIERLRRDGWPEADLDPVPYLRDPDRYIRFHNQKGKRLLRVRQEWPELLALITADRPSSDIRRDLVARVNGLGMKEASHFLRNIGHLDLAIIDRHILKHLLAAGAIEAIPTTITPRRYLAIEQAFVELADGWGLTLQEVDLLFWSFEEGSVRK